MKTYIAVLAVALVFGLAQTSNAATVLDPSPYLSFSDSPFNGTAAGASDAARDSVDGDDGAIDGNGNGGHASYTNRESTSITFTFGASVLGGLPTHAGLVWTDVGYWGGYYGSEENWGTKWQTKTDDA